MQTYSLRQESYSKTYGDLRSYKENSRSRSYVNLEKKHPRKCAGQHWYYILVDADNAFN